MPAEIMKDYNSLNNAKLIAQSPEIIHNLISQVEQLEKERDDYIDLIKEQMAERDMVIDQLQNLAIGKTIKPKNWAVNFRNSMLHDTLTEKAQQVLKKYE